MYNPSRGGVRGGADQFTWESVKTDKHRENYLGHSLMAPVGRWQKGKDLSWYAKGRTDGKTQEMIDKSELACIKKAEEEAMLIALGHNIVRKTQTLTKEDMREALRRNTERDDHHIERIDGVGAASQRIASLSGVGKNARQNNEGVAFETVRDMRELNDDDDDKEVESLPGERRKHKKSKKHKKEKKHKKHYKELHEYNLSQQDSSEYKTIYKERESEDNDNENFSRAKHVKKCKYSHRDYSSDSSDSDNRKSLKLKHHKISKSSRKEHAGYDSDGEERKSFKVKSHKKSKIKHRAYSSDSDSDSPAIVVQQKKHKKSRREEDFEKFIKEKSHKKPKHKDYSSDDSESDSHSESQKRDHKRQRKQKEFVKRHRHDTSESE